MCDCECVCIECGVCRQTHTVRQCVIIFVCDIESARLIQKRHKAYFTYRGGGKGTEFSVRKARRQIANMVSYKCTTQEFCNKQEF